jgi:hypothetical protein
MKPTEEQEEAIEAFLTGKNLAIEARAGTGKTSTLVLLAQSTQRRGQYLAFNRSIVTEAGSKMPGNVVCNTAHSLAYRAVGVRYKQRLEAPRVKSAQVARWLGLDPFVVSFGTQRKVLQPGYLAGLVMRSIGRFCQTADETPTRSHVPYVDGIDLPNAGGRTYGNNDELAAILEPALVAAWADLREREGRLRFAHEHYLKMWQLSRPYVDADYILFDEAQDANPVIAAIVQRQASHAQLVYVGDSQQEIYGFTGAVNALAQVDVPHRTFLTMSFRFGPAIAAAANESLAALNAPLRLRGNPALASSVGPVDAPRALLTRTNAAGMSRLLVEQDRGTKVHVVGEGKDIAAFATAVDQLRATGHTSHPELACFSSWADVQAYVAQDTGGEDLRLMVSLVESFETAEILAAVGRMVPESRADLVISTAHKAKGREWPTVQIASDFSKLKPENKPGLRLQYVAVTRAQERLDMTALQKDREND